MPTTIRVWVAWAVLVGCGSPRRHCEIAAQPPGDAFLWRVDRPSPCRGAAQSAGPCREGGPTVWLFGTIHDGATEVPPVVWRALAQSRRFASELGDTEPDSNELVELARLPYGKVLSQLLPPDDWWDLVDAIRGTLSEAELQHAKPWFAMTRLVSHMTRAPKPSMDDALTARAKSLAILVDALETWHDQLTALDATVGIPDLVDAIHARHEMACSLAQLRMTYSAGDLTGMARHLVIPKSEQLITARNRAWLPRIEKYLADDGAFVAVGLGHLVGENGLPSLLQQAGYRVQRPVQSP